MIKETEQKKMHEYLNEIENNFKYQLSTYVKTAKGKYLQRCKKENFNQRFADRVCVFFRLERHTNKPVLDWSYLRGTGGRFSKIGNNGMILWSYGLDENGGEVEDRSFEEGCRNKGFYTTE